MSRARLHRLLAPRSIALIGSSAWTDAVAAGNRAIGYDGKIWRVHPTRPSTDAQAFHRGVEELPEAPDAAFVAVPNVEVPGVAAALARRGAGGFVGFASGFAETGTDLGRSLTDALCEAAGDLPFLGPNCYGFVNFFDRVAMLPDQVVGAEPGRGVALICQSGTIALTLMYNRRSLPIGYLVTVGNQTRLAVEDLIEALCEDPRVTAFGLYVEGIKDAARFARAVDAARAAGKPIAIVKSGRTAAAARTAQSHTGALAGADQVFDAYCRQAGLARCDTLSTLCETLKILHRGGPLPGRRVLVMGASGGDMAMTSDVARTLDLEFAALPAAKSEALRVLLSDRVAIANPLDLHTYLWFDPPALRRVFAAVLDAGYDAVGFMLDYPPQPESDVGAYDAVVDAFIEAAGGAPSLAALISSLPETLGEPTRRRCQAGGVVPLQGQREALEALALAAAVGRAWADPHGVAVDPPATAALAGPVTAMTEPDAKAALAAHGLVVPRGQVVPPAGAAAAAAALGFPVVVKAVDARLAHKSDLGGVALDLRDAASVERAVERMTALSDRFLIEEMVRDGVAEWLAGIVLDPQFGQVLVLGTGGVLTELWSDSVSVLPPWTRERIERAVHGVKAARLLAGHRGKPPGDAPALVEAVLAIARYAEAHRDTLLELDVNPLIVRPAGRGVVAVDALIRHLKRS